MIAVRSGSVTPPPLVGEERNGGGGGGEWTLLTVARGHVVAHLVKGRLAEEGIESFLDTSNPAPGAWLLPFGDPAAPVKVFVRKFHLDWARLVISEAESLPTVGGGAIYSKRWFWPVALLVGAVLVALSLIEIFGSTSCSLGIFCP